MEQFLKLEFPLAKDLELEFQGNETFLKRYDAEYQKWILARDDYNETFAVGGDLYYKEKVYLYAKEQLSIARNRLVRILRLRIQKE